MRCHNIGCDNSDVRLVGGSTISQGTVEICYNSIWGLISDSEWDQKDAMVVCRQLGFSSNGKY